MKITVKITITITVTVTKIIIYIYNLAYALTHYDKLIIITLANPSGLK